MNISWEDAQTFLAVAEAGSISGGAHRLGLGQPTVSRRIAQLEERLGLPLFIRSKRGVLPTEMAARLLPAAEQMARWAAEFGRLAQGAEAVVAGCVRIAAPPGLAVDLLAPLAASLAARHPELRLEVLASVDYIDLARGEAELAIRLRPPTQPELMSMAEAESAVGVFAARKYVSALDARLGSSGEPRRLEELDWVSWSDSRRHIAPRPMLERAIHDFTPAFASDDYLVLRRAVREGLGAMILDRATAAPTADDLVEIDVGFRPPPTRFHLVCAKSMQFVPRVRAVARALRERIRDPAVGRRAEPTSPLAHLSVSSGTSPRALSVSVGTHFSRGFCRRSADG